MKKLHLNSTVKVKLTPFGAEIEKQMPEIDKDGYTSMKLWRFIELYGRYIVEAISDWSLYIDDKDLDEV